MYCISISHKNTETGIREAFAMNDSEQDSFFSAAGKHAGINACVLLMTCNRSEVYYTGSASYGTVERLIAGVKGVSAESIRDLSMRYGDGACIRHLYRVACGLDSAVLGEVEIIRQVKQAYLDADARGLTDAELNIIFQSALSIAKETADKSLMTKLPVSVGTLAAGAALRFAEDREQPHILIIGAAGETGGIVMRDIIDSGKNALIVGTSRRHRAELVKIAENERLRWIHYDRRYEYIEWADVIISATSSPHYTFLAGGVSERRKSIHKKQLYLDLAVPRDIDEDIDNIEGCTVKNLDYIKSLAEYNNDKKLDEAKKIEAVIVGRVDETRRLLAIRKYMETNKDGIKKLEEKSAMWLIYRLKDKLDCDTLERVLDTVKGDI